MKTEIYNAFIEKWNIMRNEYRTVYLSLQIKSTYGTAILSLPLDKIEKLFNILKISNIKDLTGKPCLALFSNGCIRTIGDFMFPNFHFISEDDADYWLDYDIYLKYKEK